jgi:hypothetical protein
MNQVVRTQTELDAALNDGKKVQVNEGYFEVHFGFVTAYGSAQVTAYGSAQVTACGSSQVRACDSAQVRACDSAQVRACGSAQVTAYDSAQVRATNYVAITIHGKNSKVRGGIKIKMPKITTPAQWCEFYGVEVKRGVAILYKGADDDFKSPRGAIYKPGTVTEADDWDGGERECGGGLHFSPRAFMALQFVNAATKFVACAVELKDMAVHWDGDYPQKCKARACRNLFECDQDGNEIKK